MKNKFYRFFVIVKHELFNYAINPAIYIGALVFFVSLAANFYFARQFFIAGRGSTDVRYFFLFIPYISILFIPILVMNAWHSNKEILEVLPIATFSKIIAKWLASFIIFFLCMAVSLVIPISVVFFGNIDISRFLCSFICILLFAAASLSFGLWISLVAKNNISAFIITAILLTIINSLHLLPLYIQLPNFVLKICNFFSFSWHFDAASKGIIDTRDYLYYGIVTVFFLINMQWHCEKQSHSSRSSAPRKVIIRRFSISISIFLAVLLLNSQFFYKRYDTTKEKQFSLAPITQELIKNLPANLSITYYLSTNLKNLYPQINDVEDLLYECANYSDLVSIKIVNADDKDLQSRIVDYGIQSQQIQTTKNNETAISEVFSGFVLECGTMVKVIPFLLSTATFEYQIDNALEYFSSGETRSVYILCGGEESLEVGYPYVKSWLQESGFSPIELTMDQISNTQKLDVRSPLLVLGNSAILKDEAVSIERFAKVGGKIFFAVSPVLADRNSWQVKPIVANPVIEMLDYWGFSIKTELVEDNANYKVTMQSQDSETQHYINYPFWIVSKVQNVSSTSPITRFFTGLEFYWASPMELFSTEYLDIHPLVESSNQSWVQKPIIDQTSNTSVFLTDPFAQQNLESESMIGKQILVASAQGKVMSWGTTGVGKETRIVVCSNQYFASDMITYTNSSYNLDFLTNSLLWLMGEDSLLNVKAKGNTNTSLFKMTDSDQLAFAEKKLLLFLAIWILFFVCGTALFVRFLRNNKQRYYCEK